MQQITPHELRQWIDSKKEFLLVDVREQWERKDFNIGGIHISTSELVSRRAEIPWDMDVVFYCEKGIRSGIAVQRLEAAGFRNLFNLSGGMKAWKTIK